MTARKIGFYTALVGALILIGLLSGCAAGPAITPSPTVFPRYVPSGQLVTYMPPADTPEPAAPAGTAVPFIFTPTPTPRTHTVQQGEDLFGIALRYGISLEELRAANPDVQPNFLSIGTVLVIPGTSDANPTVALQPPTPTALPVQVGDLSCYRTGDGGAWCFQLAHNPGDRTLESISALFRLGDGAGQVIAEQTAHLPLDLLPPGVSLPFSAFFPPPLPETFVAYSEIQRALPNPDDGRYLPVRLENETVLFSVDGRSGEASADVLLGLETSTASRVWLAVVAYDARDAVVGVRRWEMPEGQFLESGQPLNVRLFIYSAAGAIARVEMFVEARP